MQKTPQAAAALSRQVTQSQQVYAEQDGRAEPDAGTPAAPPFVKQYRALIAGGPDEKLARRRRPAGLLIQGQPERPCFSGGPSAQGREGSCAGILHFCLRPGRQRQPRGHHPPHRAHPPDTGAVRVPPPSALGRRQYGSRIKGDIALQSARLRFIHPDTGKVMDFRLPSPGHGPLGASDRKTTMEQQYKTDSEIYAVLEREIIDLTLRPGCSLSENPLCNRLARPAPSSGWCCSGCRRTGW